ncbi:MAG: hypothetical protein AAGC64_13270 [Bacteroidota bacterium]
MSLKTEENTLSMLVASFFTKDSIESINIGNRFTSLSVHKQKDIPALDKAPDLLRINPESQLIDVRISLAGDVSFLPMLLRISEES